MYICIYIYIYSTPMTRGDALLSAQISTEPQIQKSQKSPNVTIQNSKHPKTILLQIFRRCAKFRILGFWDLSVVFWIIDFWVFGCFEFWSFGFWIVVFWILRPVDIWTPGTVFPCTARVGKYYHVCIYIYAPCIYTHVHEHTTG